ncbi:MAG: cytochrome c oxidase assembly protein, partial [Pseudomonadota bacterium]|nr:cytochrome c oxidase assembly protein [Pseudomonadota bacterium]
PNEVRMVQRQMGPGMIVQQEEEVQSKEKCKNEQATLKANVERGMAWEFEPVDAEIELRIGEQGLAFYEAYNPTDKPIAGQASYNVAPFSAGGYFNKIECFCFTEQVLMPGERVQMPVSFFVDPEIVDDPEAKFAKRITLSYTFYEIDLPEDMQAALTPDQDPETTVN